MPDKKLTDAEIVKALECCKYEYDTKCELCCYNFYSRTGCRSELRRNALDLINRLQAENEELKDTVKVLRVGVEQAHIIRKDGKSPFNLLKAEIKAEAYKECIEKVKEKSKKTEIVCSGKLITTNYTISARNFNNLLKELVGDKND